MRLKVNMVFITGIVIGLCVAAIQALTELQKPVFYGVCLIGHPRDFVVSILNHIFKLNWPTAAIFAGIPTLLVIGIFVGSFLAASRNKESTLRPGPVRDSFKAALLGFLVVNFGLLWGSCPIRTGILMSYGSIVAVIAMISIIIGVILAIFYIRLRVKKEVT